MISPIFTTVDSIKSVDFIPPPAALYAPDLSIFDFKFNPMIYSLIKFKDVNSRAEYTYKHPLSADIHLFNKYNNIHILVRFFFFKYFIY